VMSCVTVGPFTATTILLMVLIESRRVLTQSLVMITLNVNWADIGVGNKVVNVPIIVMSHVPTSVKVVGFNEYVRRLVGETMTIELLGQGEETPFFKQVKVNCSP